MRRMTPAQYGCTVIGGFLGLLVLVLLAIAELG